MQKSYRSIAGSFLLLSAVNLGVLSIFSSKSVDGGAWPFVFGLHVLLNIGYVFSMGFVTKGKKNSSTLIFVSAVITAVIIFFIETYALISSSLLRDVVESCNPCRLFINSGASIYVIYSIFPIGIFLFNMLRIHPDNVEMK